MLEKGDNTVKIWKCKQIEIETFSSGRIFVLVHPYLFSAFKLAFPRDIGVWWYSKTWDAPIMAQIIGVIIVGMFFSFMVL